MRIVYQSANGKLFVERNFNKGKFYQIEVFKQEIIHLASRSRKEDDRGPEGLTEIQIKLNGIEKYV